MPIGLSPPVSCLSLLGLSVPLYFPFLSLGGLCQRSPWTFAVSLLFVGSTQRRATHLVPTASHLLFSLVAGRCSLGWTPFPLDHQVSPELLCASQGTCPPLLSTDSDRIPVQRHGDHGQGGGGVNAMGIGWEAVENRWF